MTSEKMTGTVTFVKEVGEFKGFTNNPNDESLLFDEFHYVTYQGAVTKDMYVKDLRDGTFTFSSEDVSLNSLKEAAAREISVMHKERNRRMQAQAQAALPISQPSISNSSSYLGRRRTDRRLPARNNAVGGSRPSR